MIEYYPLVLYIYGVLMIVLGAISSYGTKKSHSIVLGGITGVVMILAGLLFTNVGIVGLYIALACSTYLTIAFAQRYRKTKKFYPTAVLSVMSLVVAVTSVMVLIDLYR